MKKVIAIIFACSFIGCDDQSNFIKQPDGSYLKTELYNSGAKKIEQQFVLIEQNKYIPEGYLLEFYENGVLADSVGFLNGKKEGIERQYYETGKKKSSFFYRSGQLDSFGVVLHPNGRIASWYHRKEGRPWGMQSQFDNDGRLISTVFATGLDSIAFVAHLDTNGNVIKMKGNPIYALEKDHNNIKAGVPFSVMNFVPEFGKYKAKLIVTIKDDKKNTVLERKAQQLEYELNASAYFLDYVFEKPGRYIYNGIVTLFDTTNQVALISDTVRAQIMVR